MRDGVAAPKVDEAAIGRFFREESGRSVATLVRVFGDIDVAEDAVQEAFAVALSRWPGDGLPPNPGGWITTTAGNRAIDRLRRDARGRPVRRVRAGDRSHHPEGPTRWRHRGGGVASRHVLLERDGRILPERPAVLLPVAPGPVEGAGGHRVWRALDVESLAERGRSDWRQMVP